MTNLTKSSRLALGLTAAIALGAVATMPADAKVGIKAGVLSCDVSPGAGFILGSSKNVHCTFKGDHGVEHYTGSIGKIGLDVGVTGKTSMAWLVFAQGKLNRGALAGSYGGASAQATAGVGLGANVLIGGSNKSISLQPLSVQAQTGLNLAAGLANLTLHYAK